MIYIAQKVRYYRGGLYGLKWPYIETKAFALPNDAHQWAIDECVAGSQLTAVDTQWPTAENIPIGFKADGWSRSAPNGYTFTPYNTGDEVWIRIEAIEAPTRRKSGK